MKGMIAARYGKIETLTIYRYLFQGTGRISISDETNSEGNKIYNLKKGKYVDLFFETKIKGLKFDTAYEIMANTLHSTNLSSVLSMTINRHFSQYYTKYQGWNSFIYDQKEIGKFNVLNLFDYNLQVYDDTTFFINFDISVTHIYLGNIDYNRLKNFLSNHKLSFTPSVFITHVTTAFRTKVLDLTKSVLKQDNMNNYHFSFPNDMMEYYFKDVQAQIFKKGLKQTESFISEIQDFSHHLDKLSGVKWSNQLLQNITLNKVLPNGILVGNNFVCSKLQASY